MVIITSENVTNGAAGKFGAFGSEQALLAADRGIAVTDNKEVICVLHNLALAMVPVPDNKYNKKIFACPNAQQGHPRCLGALDPSVHDAFSRWGLQIATPYVPPVVGSAKVMPKQDFAEFAAKRPKLFE